MYSGDAPVYYEGSWAILSTIGLTNVLYGIAIVGITCLTPMTSIPIVVSAALAVANGLCFYSYYADYPVRQQIIASAFADIFWLVQEAGTPFYSFFILLHILQERPWRIFMVLFWVMIAFATGFRIGILVTRIRLILSGTTALQPIVNNLHIGYFVSIAVVEIVGAVFLLRKFAEAKRTNSQLPTSGRLFNYLMRSTEIRIALLALLGIARAITHSFQTTAQIATSLASQFDRFVYTLQCLFPMMLMIDILASRVVFNKDTNGYGSEPRDDNSSRGRGMGGIQEQDIGMNSISRGGGTQIGAKRKVEITARKTRRDSIGRSTERVIDPSGSVSPGSSGISKTVEFEVTESIAVPEYNSTRRN